MRVVLAILTALALLVIPSPLAAAHSQEYYSIGPVTFQPEDLIPDGNGVATINVRDDVWALSGFSWCQAAVCTPINAHPACDFIELYSSGLGANWNPDVAVTVVIDEGKLGGDTLVCTGLLVACGFYPFYALGGSHGWVDHINGPMDFYCGQ